MAPRFYLASSGRPNQSHGLVTVPFIHLEPTLFRVRHSEGETIIFRLRSGLFVDDEEPSEIEM